MPNWSSNATIITANDEAGKIELAEFIAKLKDEDTNELGMFGKFIPCPPEFYNDNRWYNWCVNNWGTKWDVFLHEIEFIESDDPASFHIVYDTAWNPPVDFFVAISKLYPNLNFFLAFSEAGMSIAGSFDISNNNIINQTSMTPMFNDDGEPIGNYSEFLDRYYITTGG